MGFAEQSQDLGAVFPFETIFRLNNRPPADAKTLAGGIRERLPSIFGAFRSSHAFLSLPFASVLNYVPGFAGYSFQLLRSSPSAVFLW